MARVVNVDIPSHKRGEIGLTYVFGIGRSSARKILTTANVDPDKRVEEWTDQELNDIRTIVRDKYVTEGELRRALRQATERLRYIGCYRGIRHRLGLPVRGQRTRTNARTRKGKKKTVANKKKAAKK